MSVASSDVSVKFIDESQALKIAEKGYFFDPCFLRPGLTEDCGYLTLRDLKKYVKEITPELREALTRSGKIDYLDGVSKVISLDPFAIDMTTPSKNLSNWQYIVFAVKCEEYPEMLLDRDSAGATLAARIQSKGNESLLSIFERRNIPLPDVEPADLSIQTQEEKTHASLPKVINQVTAREGRLYSMGSLITDSALLQKLAEKGYRAEWDRVVCKTKHGVMNVGSIAQLYLDDQSVKKIVMNFS